MVSLKEHLNHLNFSTQLIEVNRLLDEENAKAKVSFWGGRLVKVDGYEGTISLEALSKKVLQASKQRCEADDLTPAERIAGIEIVKKIQNFYKVSDENIKNSNCLTRLINWLREFTFWPYTTRFYMEDHQEFRAFGEERFLQQFGRNPNAETWNHPASDGGFGPPYRICAKENLIRALVH